MYHHELASDDRILEFAWKLQLHIHDCMLPSSSSCPIHHQQESAALRYLRIFDPGTTVSRVEWRSFIGLEFNKKSRKTHFMSRAVSSRRSRSQQCCASIIYGTPKLRADLVELRAHLDTLVSWVELKSTLQVRIVHCACWELRILIFVEWLGRIL